MSSTSTRRRRQVTLPPVKMAGLVLGVVLFTVPLLVDVPGLEPVGQRMLAIFLLALVLFVTEAIPLFATGALIVMLQVLLISDEALMPLAEPAGAASEFYSVFAHPVVILFLGGFLIADGAAKYRLDRNLASVVLTPFRHDARLALLALMLLTATLSMFMSNTATAATMFAVLIPVLAALPTAAARAGFALCIPLAANLGGLGTPIASPPNAIAVAALAERGVNISFLTWMLALVPLMIIMLLIGWAYLAARYVPRGTALALDLQRDVDTSPAAIFFYVVTATTILLWFTEPLHGISATTVGFLPVVALFASTVMNGDDLRALQWPVLWLVAGGIALGAGVGRSGLDDWFVSLVSWDMLPAGLLLLVLALFTWALGNLLSNTATANLLIPIALALAISINADLLTVGLLLAATCSFGFVLPVSTPPNAIAYATGTVKSSDMIVMGLVLGGAGVLLLALLMPTLWSFMGVI
ncbi:MAG: DASS family sodium-coupled anion symporter [Mobilicoccus sp.]|nr:DASS family sodium-coupled anion symporter [Mobilicoccus sp.]